MWKFLIVSLFIAGLTAQAFAQKIFNILDGSKNYSARVEVEKCDDTFCEGKVTFQIFKKGDTKKPFQIFKFTETSFMVEEGQKSKTKLRYDYQSVVFFDDYNFDGKEDLALRSGNNSSYGLGSYQIYLYSLSAKKFVHNRALTNLAESGLGMFEVITKRKVLQVSSKSGCCWHQTEEFQVINNRPKKVLEITEDATSAHGNKVKVTTRRLVNGRWQTKVKYQKMEE